LDIPYEQTLPPAINFLTPGPANGYLMPFEDGPYALLKMGDFFV
jgi:hypothetical protein